MLTRAGNLTVRLDSPQADAIRRALSAQPRARILNLLATRSLNVSEIALALGISQPNTSTHIRILEEAGLVESESVSTGRALEKRCWLKFDRLTFEAVPEPVPDPVQVQVVSMPVGLFTAMSIPQEYGLASETVFLQNGTNTILTSDRAQAQILWFGRGWVEYTFPCILSQQAQVVGIEFEGEMCSETLYYDNSYKSDITLWLNGAEIATWTCPGDFGGRKGRLTPSWWPKDGTQFGVITTWSVDGTGSRINDEPAGGCRIQDLGLVNGRPIIVRIGNRGDAIHRGGMNLFGRRFGDYPQDLILRISYISPGQ